MCWVYRPPPPLLRPPMLDAWNPHCEVGDCLGEGCGYGWCLLPHHGLAARRPSSRKHRPPHLEKGFNFQFNTMAVRLSSYYCPKFSGYGLQPRVTTHHQDHSSTPGGRQEYIVLCTGLSTGALHSHAPQHASIGIPFPGTAAT